MWEYIFLVVAVIIVLLIALVGRKYTTLQTAASASVLSNSLPGLGPALSNSGLSAQNLVGGARRRNTSYFEEEGISS
jgi:hypothetical protein